MASCAENSTSSQSFFANLTDSFASFKTSSLVFLSICSICISEVDVKTCILELLAGLIASKACSISSCTQRAREAMVEFFIFFAIRLTPSQSPGEEAANPASITSTLSFSNC